MNYFIYRMIISNAILVIATLLILLVSVIIIKRYGYKWRKIIWLVIVVFALIPIKSIFLADKISEIVDYNYVVFKINDNTLDWNNKEIKEVTDKKGTADVPISEDSITKESDIGYSNLTGEQLKSKSDSRKNNLVTEIILIWVTGVFVSIQSMKLKYKKLKHDMEKNSSTCCGEINVKIHEICNRLGIKRKIEARYNSVVSAPFIFGNSKPIIYLPENIDTKMQNLDTVLLHELYHYKAGDIIYKWIINVACCLYWYNPVMYFVRKIAYEDLEYVCDSKVTSHMSSEQIISYCYSILVITPMENKFILSFGSAKNKLKKRFDNCFNRYNGLGNRRLSLIFTIVVICLSVTLSSCGYGVFEKNQKNNEKKSNALPKINSGDIDDSKNTINNESEDNVNYKDDMITRLSDREVHYDTGLVIKEEDSIKLREMWFEDLDENQISEVKEIVFWTHFKLEDWLVYRFSNNDCSPDSKVWNHVDDAPDDNVIMGYTGVEMIEDYKKAKEIINKESFSNYVDNIIRQLQLVIDTHDIDLLYEIHQEAHDLSYYAVNYPLGTLEDAPPDWHGIYVYFGKLDNIIK